MLEYRPLLYRAADLLDPSGSARELADSLRADLYGVQDAGDERRSLFRYFQGRSSLATWLRAVLAQRHVDRLRVERRLEPLPDEEHGHHLAAGGEPPDPDRPRYLALVRQAFGRVVAHPGDRDRLRLGCYYVQELTLAETGRVLKEHEATVSRQLARTRRDVREAVEHQLRDGAGLNDDQIAEGFASVAGDPGPIDLQQIFGPVRSVSENQEYAPSRPAPPARKQA